MDDDIFQGFTSTPLSYKEHDTYPTEIRSEFRAVSSQLSLAFRKACLDNLQLIAIIEDQQLQLSILKQEMQRTQSAYADRLASDNKISQQHVTQLQEQNRRLSSTILKQKEELQALEHYRFYQEEVCCLRKLIAEKDRDYRKEAQVMGQKLFRSQEGLRELEGNIQRKRRRAVRDYNTFSITIKLGDDLSQADLKTRISQKDQMLGTLNKQIQLLGARLAQFQSKLDRDSKQNMLRRDKAVQAGFHTRALGLQKEFSIIIMPFPLLDYSEKPNFERSQHRITSIAESFKPGPRSQMKRLSNMLNGLGIKNKNLYSSLYSRIQNQ